MRRRDDEPVWYAAYGSNCLAARFAVYLTGGAAPGAIHAEPGARDPRPPTATAPHTFATGVRFVGDAAKWGGGGVAFLDHSGGRPAAGRRYLVTKGQFDDIVAQESGRDRFELPLDTMEPGRLEAIGDRRYDGLWALDPIDDVGVFTFTSPQPLDTVGTNAPSSAYLSTILRGLLEVHTVPVGELVEGLLAAPGITPRWTAEMIRTLAK